METQLVTARRLARTRGLATMFALVILLSASLAVQQAPGKDRPHKGSHSGKGHPHKGGEDLARYILPPGNYGGIPFTQNSTDQLPLYSGLTPLRDNIGFGDIERRRRLRRRLDHRA